MTKNRISWPVMTLTSGPVDAYPAVLRGLSRTIAYDYDPAFAGPCVTAKCPSSCMASRFWG